MASSNFALLLLAFSLLAVSAVARPCKTLFFITSTSYYQIPTTISRNPNPNPNFFLRNPSISPRFRAFVVTTSGFRDDAPKFGLLRPSVFFRRSDPFLIRGPDPVFFEREDAVEHVEDGEELESRSSSMIPMEFYSSVTSSIRDRTKDIMRVVGALLFGVGCGALTAATMYLIWSLFWPNRFEFEDSDDDFEDGNGDYDVSSAKKMGYVAIPTKVVYDDLKKPAAPAKEVV
ncbi:hypothetical protein R3W88_007550 [Solanum pinnatisectum]|uniref:Uncharacterized protein n=1 Tax=Solanum pinnatisectum TaxID=50273 RepID=A0AAV9M7Y4_9SOLN|nr:hypothetical protein R3W88_007550 [Solanum pinnatisectum]